MKTFKENIDLIERYLDEDLDPAELKKFNLKLEQDPEFQRLYHDMDRLVEGIQISARKTTIEEKLANLENSLPFHKSRKDSEETPVIRLWDRVMQYKVAVAAAIAMLFVATFILITQDFATDPGKLYAENFEPFPNVGPGNTRSAEKDDKQQAYTYYDMGKYEDALKIFTQMDMDTADKLYAANAYMAIGEITKAITLLEQVSERGTGLSIHAKWYLALCNMQEENLASARTLFTELKDQGGEYHQEAARILEKMDKIRN
jgi:tetratricopeptide (TPR) repeat protein